MAAQLPLEERVAHANVVLDNEGDEEELALQVERLWDGLAACASG
jgi:dephospho-CoA kinase